MQYRTGVLSAVLLWVGLVEALAQAPPRLPSLMAFRDAYPLKPVRGYTFLGTERSSEKPIVRADGTIEGWFTPADHVPWLGEAIQRHTYRFGQLDGYLPIVSYRYFKPGAADQCELTALAVDAESGRVALYVDLVVTDAAGHSSEKLLLLKRVAGAIDASPLDRKLLEAQIVALRSRWSSFFARGVPAIDDPLLTVTCKASIVRAMLTFSGKHPHYGVKEYGKPQHDGFPPTILSLCHCLIDWGHADLAAEYLSYYFEHFVSADGRFKYYGPSLAEYGQMLLLVQRLHGATANRKWLDAAKPKLAAMRDWIWQGQKAASGGLLAGVPEADTRSDVAVYFHNNGWLWRGLTEWHRIVPDPNAARLEGYRSAIVAAVDAMTRRDVSPGFVPPTTKAIAPFATMTQDGLSSYTNYRYWPELLSCGALPAATMNTIVDYRRQHGGEAGGMTAFREWADNWPIVDYAEGLLQLGRLADFDVVLMSHVAGHQTPETDTAYEQVAVTGDPYRPIKADYCVPVQLAAPRMVAMRARWLAEQGRQP